MYDLPFNRLVITYLSSILLMQNYVASKLFFSTSSAVNNLGKKNICKDIYRINS